MRLPWKQYICQSKYGCFCSSPEVAYLHTKNEGGLKIFISKFASISQRTVLKFHGRYVDTLVLAKPDNFHTILDQLNCYHKNLHFTVDKFEDGNVHYPDISLHRTSTDVKRKDTNTWYGRRSRFLVMNPGLAESLDLEPRFTALLVFAKLTLSFRNL